MSRAAVLESLRTRIKGLERSIEDRPGLSVSSSFRELDALLPGGGLALGSIVELLQSSEGCGAFSLALRLAHASIAARGGTWAVLDTDHSFYPGATLPELNLEKLLLIRTEPRHAAWAFNQLLRCPDLGACFMSTPLMDNMTFRRFQLAAERGGALGFVIRPVEAQRKPCWASVRLQIAPFGRATGGGLRIEQQQHSQSAIGRHVEATLLHIRGAKAEGTLVLEP
jgi:hypothetical protein